MSERQKRRRSWGRQKALADGRAWDTGASHTLAVRVNRMRANGHPGYVLPDVRELETTRRDSASGAARKNRLELAKARQNVRLVGTPAPVVSTFTYKDL